MNLSFKSKLFLALLGLTAMGGVLLAQFIDKGRVQETPQSLTQQTLLSEIILAALKDPLQAERENPALIQSSNYKTDDLLALRITTQPSVSTPLQFSARLLTPSGGVVPLDPPSFTIQPGTSVFCCWQIEEPNNYTLQLFRPEGTVTSIPLPIRQTSGATGPSAAF